MTDRYERIRAALAMGPTPGPWVPKELPRDMQHDGYRFSVSRGGLDWWMIAKVTHEANCYSGAANAAMIAACDPDTIRELLAERDQLAAEIEVLRAEVERDKALLRQALTALESSDWYIGQLEWIVYSPDDTGTHEERAKVQSTIAALRERLRAEVERLNRIVSSADEFGGIPLRR